MKKVIKWAYVKDIVEDDDGKFEDNYYIINVDPDDLFYDRGVWETKFGIGNWWFEIEPNSGRLADDAEIPENNPELSAYARLIDLSSVPLPEDGELIIVTQKIEQSINYHTEV